MCKKLISICFFIFSAAYCQAENVLILTDIHFNPYSGCSIRSQNVSCNVLKDLIEKPVESWPIIFTQESINGFKQETNNAFLTQGVNNLVITIQKDKIKTILVIGDLLEHNFDTYYKKLAPSKYNNQQNLTEFIYKTIVYTLQTIQVKFPDSKLYLVLGNNDTDYSDYQLPSTGLLESMAAYLSQSIDKTIDKKEFINSYSQGGYFTAPLINDVTLIGLNSDVLSAVNSNPILAKQQLAWLQEKLNQAVNLKKKVILFQHIPYGADLYKSSVKGRFIPLLNPDLQAAYLELLSQYSSTILVIYTGHYHAELLSTVDSSIPVIGSIAFNTMFGNNPGFKVVDIRPNGDFAGYTTYYSDLTNKRIKWKKLYSFEQAYGQPKEIIKILNQFPLRYTEPKVISYRKYFNGNNQKYLQPVSSDKNWKFYYCGIKYIQPKEYSVCTESITFFNKRRYI